MIIEDEITLNGFELKDSFYEKTEVRDKDHKNRIRITINGSDVTISVDTLDKDDKVAINKTDTIDVASIQRLEVNRGLSNPLAYIISQVAQYGEISRE